MTTSRSLVGLITLVLWGCLTPGYAAAACGDITYEQPAGLGASEATVVQVPIIDCDNPFATDAEVGYSPVLRINDTLVPDGGEVTVVPGEPVSLEYATNPANYGSFLYVDVYQRSDAGYEQLSSGFGSDYFLTGLPAGEYVAIYVSETLFQVSNPRTWPQAIKEFFLPETAHAFSRYPDYAEVTSVRFTIVLDEPPVATGPSSVLFLPGIMGSRLYEESAVCTEETSVQQRWFSRDQCDQLRLKTTFIGKSEHDIFTTNNQSGIVESIFGFSLYESFLESLQTKKDAGTISDYQALPYDWRLSLDDVVRSAETDGRAVGGQVSTIQEGLLYQTLSQLAAESLSGKVSIVTHSNGGLLAKYFLDALAKTNDPLLDQIDHLFLVGVPQTGTPESLVSMLHGSGIFAGLILKQENNRVLVNQMPSAHHLLPSQDYFTSQTAADFPVVRFQPGELTDTWRDTYGEAIESVDQLHAFLDKNSGRPKPATADLLQPEVVDPALLTYADIAHRIQSAWQPPPSMQVHQLAGTGVLTPVNIMYFTDLECTARSILSGFMCTEYGPKLGYRITQLTEGDGTVAFSSASAMDTSNNINYSIIDLDKYNDENSARVHRDLFEIQEVQSYIFDNILATSSTDFNYLSSTSVPSQSEPRLVFQLHSPLDMQIVADGLAVSSSTNQITGSTYERFGEVQYISVPRSIGEFTLVLIGEATGSFTLEIEEWQGDTMQVRTDFVAVPSIAGTRVELVVRDDIVPDTIVIDYDGDGQVDAVVSTDGVVEEPGGVKEEDTVAEEELVGSKASATRIGQRAPAGQVAGITTSNIYDPQQLYQLKKALQRLADVLTLLSNV